MTGLSETLESRPETGDRNADEGVGMVNLLGLQRMPIPGKVRNEGLFSKRLKITEPWFS